MHACDSGGISWWCVIVVCFSDRFVAVGALWVSGFLVYMGPWEA